MDVVRTPEESLQGLPDFPFESSYREIDGLRLAYLDEGEGKPVVFFHGEPTWSFLWRKVIPPVRDAGYRCIAPDYAGFGRSDKPTDLDWYTYDRHVELISKPARGARRARRHRRRPRLGRADRPAARGRAPRPLLAPGDHGDRPLHRPAADERGLAQFREFVRENADVPVGMLVRGGCKNDPGDEVIAAYEAPYPSPEAKAGARAFPLILPTEPDAPGAAEGKRVADALREDERPALVLWADSDPVLPFSVGERVSTQLNFPAPRAIEDAGHFLQEDAGPQIGAIIAEWLG